jgi:3-deoxy-D-manno-octulosonic-acid transferase
MQSKRDKDRIASLGAQHAEVFGNCKFDEAAQGLSIDAEALRSEFGLNRDPVIVIGSTRSEVEETLVLDAISKVGLNRVQIIHAPRHLERVEDLASDVRTRFGNVARRSLHETGRYLLLDTYGELSQVYGLADIAIVGGGFANLGGQNIIQPLAHGKPVLHGPHMQNFSDVASEADAAGASITCSDADSLADAIQLLLEDPARRTEMGVAAKSVVDRHLGASKRYAAAIADAARSSYGRT